MSASALGLQDVELLAPGADGKQRRVAAAQALEGKTVATYFSAHWCPPCRGFTPVLARVYKKLQAQGKPFEVVFVTCDRNEAQFQEYYSTMPWLAVPFHDTATRQRLSARFSLSGIPRLVIVGPDGQVVASDARAAVAADQEGANFPWTGAAGGGGGLVGLLLSPRGLMMLLMLMYWLTQWFTKKQ